MLLLPHTQSHSCPRIYRWHHRIVVFKKQKPWKKTVRLTILRYCWLFVFFYISVRLTHAVSWIMALYRDSYRPSCSTQPFFHSFSQGVSFKEFKKYCVSNRWVGGRPNLTLSPAKRTKPFRKKMRRLQTGQSKMRFNHARRVSNRKLWKWTRCTLLEQGLKADELTLVCCWNLFGRNYCYISCRNDILRLCFYIVFFF